MPDSDKPDAGETHTADTDRQLTPAAERALAEARARREKIDAVSKTMPKEVNGPRGLEPSRFGDWEKDGIASDF